MIQQDHGAAVAADASRLAVAPLHRGGGQAQFILRNQPTRQTGFPSPSNFRALFQRTLGVSPSEYRRTFRGERTAPRHRQPAENRTEPSTKSQT